MMSYHSELPHGQRANQAQICIRKAKGFYVFYHLKTNKLESVRIKRHSERTSLFFCSGG